MRYYRLTDREGLAESGWFQAILWRRAAHWMYLRWWVTQDRAHWLAITEMSLEGTDGPD